MRRRVVPALALALCFAAAACSSSSKPSVAATSPSSSTAPTTTAAPAASTLALAANTKVGQPVVVESKGLSVYLFIPDGPSTVSQVPAGIKANWPAVTVSGAPTAGTGLDAAKLVAAAQPDGTNQVAYNGHLLYTFSGDKAPGDAAGQGLGGSWYVLSAAGDKVG